MKINKWTLGLAAVGLVSLASVAQADEKTAVMTALSATTISGYVDTAMVWNPGTGNANPAPFSFNAGKQDGFNLNSVDIKIAKPMEEGQWSSGYTVELMAGPDTAGVTPSAGTGADIRQAFVATRMPIGNGLDWQIGRWDNIIGYESTDSYKNPNWTRSYGYTLEPTEHTGVLASYKANDMISLSVGAANTVTTGAINAKTTRAESKKALVSLITLTAPESMGAVAGSALYAGLDYGPGAITSDRTHVYVGATIKTPAKGLSLGAAWDSINHCDVAGVDTGYAMTVAAYVSFKPSDDSKWSAHLRGEYGRGAALGALADAANGTLGNPLRKVIAVTGTLQYDLWANVISRLELRWDHNAGSGGGTFSGTVPGTGIGAKKNEVMVAANVVYKF